MAEAEADQHQDDGAEAGDRSEALECRRPRWAADLAGVGLSPGFELNYGWVSHDDELLWFVVAVRAVRVLIAPGRPALSRLMPESHVLRSTVPFIRFRQPLATVPA